MSNEIKKCYVVVHTVDLSGGDYYTQMEAHLIKTFLCKTTADKFAEQFVEKLEEDNLNSDRPKPKFTWNDAYKYWANADDYVQVEEIDLDDAVI